MIRSCQVDHLNWKEFSDRVAQRSGIGEAGIFVAVSAWCCF